MFSHSKELPLQECYCPHFIANWTLPVYFPYPSFEHAASDVLQHLHHKLGFAFWAISRSEEDELELIVTLDKHYGVQQGARIKWTDSICCRMVDGLGPNIAPDLDHVPAYKQAPIAQRFPISAYIGFPLWDSDGQLFGTLAAVDPKPQTKDLIESESTFQLFSRLISTHLSLDLQVRSQSDKCIEFEGIIDSETKLLNNLGWNRLLRARQRRAESNGLNSYVVSITFDSVEQILLALDPIRKVLGPYAVLARGNDNQVLVCMPDVSKEDGDQAMAHLSKELGSCLKVRPVIRSLTKREPSIV